MIRHLAVFILFMLAVQAYPATAPGYEDFLLGDSRESVLRIIREKYSKYLVRETVDERFGIPVIEIAMIRQEMRKEISLEFNYRNLLNRITVKIFGMSDEGYDALLSELEGRYGGAAVRKTLVKPNLKWYFDGKKYDLEVSHWGDHVRMDYGYRPAR